MTRRPPRSTRTYTLFPSPTLFPSRSSPSTTIPCPSSAGSAKQPAPTCAKANASNSTSARTRRAPPFISDSSRNRGTVPESPQRTGDCPAAMPDREGNVMSYENIIVEKEAGVGIITLNRPKALNALCKALIADLEEALDDQLGRASCRERGCHDV